MLQTITITPSWQIHIPVELRKILGLEKPGLAEIKVVKDAFLIRPKTSPILRLAGKYAKIRPIVKIDLEKIRQKIDYSQL